MLRTKRKVPRKTVRTKRIFAACPRCGRKGGKCHAHNKPRILAGLVCDYEILTSKYYCKDCRRYYTHRPSINMYRARDYADEVVEEAMRVLCGAGGTLWNTVHKLRKRYGLVIPIATLQDWNMRGWGRGRKPRLTA